MHSYWPARTAIHARYMTSSCVQITSSFPNWLFCFSLACGLGSACHGLFSLPLSVFGRLCSVNLAIPEYFLCYIFAIHFHTPHKDAI